MPERHRRWDDTATTSYFQVLPSLSASTKPDVRQALESPGPAKLFSYPELGWFAIGGGEKPVITRYVLNERDQLVSVQSAQPLNERRQGRNEDENGHTTAVCHGTRRLRQLRSSVRWRLKHNSRFGAEDAV